MAQGDSIDKRIILPYEIVTEDNVKDYIDKNY